MRVKCITLSEAKDGLESMLKVERQEKRKVIRSCSKYRAKVYHNFAQVYVC